MKKMIKILSFIIIAFFSLVIPTNFAYAASLECQVELNDYADDDWSEKYSECTSFMMECEKEKTSTECMRVYKYGLEKRDNPTGSDCSYIFGDPTDETSVAYMIQRVFDYAKVIAPLLVILLSGFDFAKNALSGDQDAMKKATSKLVTRLLCAVALYFVPILTGFILNLINNSSVDQTCNIS